MGTCGSEEALERLFTAFPLCWILILDLFHGLIIPTAKDWFLLGSRIIQRNLSQQFFPFAFQTAYKALMKSKFSSFFLSDSATKNVSQRPRPSCLYTFLGLRSGFIHQNKLSRAFQQKAEGYAR